MLSDVCDSRMALRDMSTPIKDHRFSINQAIVRRMGTSEENPILSTVKKETALMRKRYNPLRKDENLDDHDISRVSSPRIMKVSPRVDRPLQTPEKRTP